MWVLTNEEMRAADRYTIEVLGAPSLELMERAGVALANACEELAGEGAVLCVCGGGNNGGDGFACARILRERGREVDALCAATKFSEECAANKERWLELGGEILPDFPPKTYALVVDCLFGTGFRGRLTGVEGELVEGIYALRGMGAQVLSCDIPSGVNGDSGLVDGLAVRADYTLCIGEVKRGALLGDGVDHCGTIARADIGIALPKAEYAYAIDEKLAGALLPRRKRNSHKGSYGKAAIVAGSVDYTGAAYLSTAACLRSGVGYTALFLPKELLPAFMLKAPEALLCEVCEGGRYAFNEKKMQTLLGYDAVAYGMGLGVSEDVYLGVQWLLKRYQGKLLLDADGLNSLAAFGGEEAETLFAQAQCEIALTPHVKEFSRLSGEPAEAILEKGVEYAQAYAKRRGVTVLLKNALSTVTDGERTAFNSTGNSGQAKGGSGDVLSGLLVGLLAQGLSALEGSELACYLAGKAAEFAARQTGEYALTASDCIAHIGKAFLFVA